MRFYELVLVMRTSLSDADQKKLIKEIKDSLGDIKVAKEEEWGQKPLAYSIKKEVAGVYHVLHLEGESGVPEGFETSLLRNDTILRHLLVRTK